MTTTMKVTRERRTEETRLAEVREQIKKAREWVATLEAREAGILAEIKAKRDALDALVK